MPNGSGSLAGWGANSSIQNSLKAGSVKGLVAAGRLLLVESLSLGTPRGEGCLASLLYREKTRKNTTRNARELGTYW